MARMKWDKPAEFEYLQAADPEMPSVPIAKFPGDLHRKRPAGIIHFDNSQALKTDYPATSPNCLASFVHIEPGKPLTTDIQATSHLFYVLRGRGEMELASSSVKWAQDDIITIPACDSIMFRAETDAAMYWVNDSPLLKYLGVKPDRTIFNPVRYEKEWLREQVKKESDQPGATARNRIGILLASSACPLTRTVTPTLWALLEVVPPHLVLPPHRHNSVALDLAISGCSRGYTLMGPEIDAQGKIINPARVDWADASAFTTPAMLWHEHHNEGEEDAWVLPIQDAGLVTYDRILEIKFAAGGPTKRGVSAF